MYAMYSYLNASKTAAFAAMVPLAGSERFGPSSGWFL